MAPTLRPPTGTRNTAPSPALGVSRKNSPPAGADVAMTRLLALVAVLAAVAVPVAADGMSSHSTGSAHRLSAKQLAFHDGMRKLWEDHITWTRLAIISFAADLPDLQATEDRLLANQADIGNAIKPYYGRAAGAKLTKLLREHILGAVDLLVAARSGDAAKIGAAKSAWYANGNQIADFLHSANPHAWGKGAMRSMMKIHLDETLAEAVDRLNGRFAADVADYDKVHRHILEMADMLSGGIMQQFPRRF
jgi:hypothetical protein